MDALSLALRVGLSLACVLGLVWLLSKGLLTGGTRGRGHAAERVSVLTRQSLSRTGSLAVVRVGDRALVLGVTEQQVTLLTETDLTALTMQVADMQVADMQVADMVTVEGLDVLPRQQRRRERPDHGRGGALAGSALSPGTWAQALDVLRERTTRR